MKLFANIKASWKTIQAQPKGERFAYFWEYYKWPAIIAVVLTLALLQFTIGLANRKETVFSGYVLNSNAVEKDEEFSKFLVLSFWQELYIQMLFFIPLCDSELVTLSEPYSSFQQAHGLSPSEAYHYGSFLQKYRKAYIHGKSLPQ